MHILYSHGDKPKEIYNCDIFLCSNLSSNICPAGGASILTSPQIKSGYQQHVCPENSLLLWSFVTSILISIRLSLCSEIRINNVLNELCSNVKMTVLKMAFLIA